MGTAAELLRKGGTLVSESCSVCSGVQVKYSGKIICVSCGKEEAERAAEPIKQELKGDTITELKNVVLDKINELIPSLRSEKDPDKQAEIAKLIKSYLEVLEKIPKDNESRQ